MSGEISKYIKEYVVKSYEADCHGFLRILTLLNWLQDIAVENAQYLGFGFEACREQNLAWVGSNYVIKINRLPKIDEHVIIETWPAEGKLWGAVRDFIIKDEKRNDIIRVSSQWVLINYEVRRPVLLKKYFPEYKFLPERTIDTDFPKIEATEGKTVTEFKVRFDDIDVNNHVNNAVYLLWASESVDSAYRMSHTVAAVEVCFKKEALYGESVAVYCDMQDNESTHIIKDKNSGQELAECRLKWRKITS